MLAMVLDVSVSAADVTKPDVRANKIATNQNLSKRKMLSKKELLQKLDKLDLALVKRAASSLTKEEFSSLYQEINSDSELRKRLHSKLNTEMTSVINKKLGSSSTGDASISSTNILKNIDSLDGANLKLLLEEVKKDPVVRKKILEKLDKDTLLMLNEKINSVVEDGSNKRVEEIKEISFEDILRKIDNLNENNLKLFIEEVKKDPVVRKKILEKLDKDTLLMLNEKIIPAVAANEKYDGLAVLSEDILKGSDLPITTKFMVRNDCFREDRTIEVKGIVVHSTATPGRMADSWYEDWNTSYDKGETEREVCVHAFLDDKGVQQYLPWNHRGWHAGGKANNTHIGFEICEPAGLVYNEAYDAIVEIDVDGTREYFEKAYDNAVKLCVLLCRQFGLTEKDIVCHCEAHELGIASDSQDVMHWWKFYDKDLDDFRADVKKGLEKHRRLESEEKPEAKIAATKENEKN